MVENRSIALYIVLTVITCGIFGIYWMVVLNDDTNRITNNPDDMSGGIVVLLTIVTCGIFGWYWNYKQGEKLDKYEGQSSNSILYLVLSIFGLSIISYALMQDRLNKYSNNPNNNVPF